MFTDENTDGYSPHELAELNREWDAIAELENLDEHTDEWDARYKAFCDEVARRRVEQ